MPYDEHFYRLYEAYLHEPTVRANHTRALKHFEDMRLLHTGCVHDVIDLGCGLGEYPRFAQRFGGRYVGFDKENATLFVPEAESRFTPVVADYTDHKLAERLNWRPNAFISLFSIEACLPVGERYALYHRLFKTIPSLACGMSAGFYYASKRNEETVEENGNIVSYQTIDDPYDHVDPLFEEDRLILRTPSALFGPDVVEVWKFFQRK